MWGKIRSQEPGGRFEASRHAAFQPQATVYGQVAVWPQVCICWGISQQLQLPGDPAVAVSGDQLTPTPAILAHLCVCLKAQMCVSAASCCRRVVLFWRETWGGSCCREVTQSSCGSWRASGSWACRQQGGATTRPPCSLTPSSQLLAGKQNTCLSCELAGWTTG